MPAKLRGGFGDDDLSKPLIESRHLVDPKTPNQKRTVEQWSKSEILFLVGLAGVGKTHLSLGLALQDALNHKRDSGPKPKILLTRPTVGVDADPGLFPGDAEEKLLPWIAPFFDVFGNLSTQSWEQIRKVVDIELVHFSLLRGRTVGTNHILIADECQTATYNQLKCLLTRVGKGGKIVICGDPYQADNFDEKTCPLTEVTKKLTGLDGVTVIKFGKQDQQRSGIVNAILERL